jgi:peptidoglycan/LPS O-acetylase OafA/YrhL
MSRIVFCFASVLLVLAFYKNAFSLPKLLSIPLTQLGVITYGVYLLHPKVYQVVLLVADKLHLNLTPHLIIVAAILGSIIAAQLSFKLLEEPFIRIGKKLTSSRTAGNVDDGRSGAAARKVPN